MPSYATAMKTTRVALTGPVGGVTLPDYLTAVSAPPSPSAESPDPLASITPQPERYSQLLTPDVWFHQRRASALPPLHMRGLVA